MSIFWYFLSFLVVIAILVFVHEYGHFWMARKCGIKVLRFSIGFGKVLWRKQDRHGTEFAISLIPLGGYVQMLDSKASAIDASEHAYDYSQKSIGQRALVIAAGPAANFIFAILVFWVIYLVGIPTVKPVIGQVMPNSIAAYYQLSEDMQISTIDGKQVKDWNDVNLLLASKIGDHEVDIVVTPMDEPQQLIYKKLDLSEWRYEPQKESAVEALGIVPQRGKIELIISKIVENSPAAFAGLRVGDEIIHINKQSLDWQQILALVKGSHNKELTIEVKREGQQLLMNVIPKLNQEGVAYIGIAPTYHPIEDKYLTMLRYNFIESLQQAVVETTQLCTLIFSFVGKLLSGDIALSNLGGPLSIAQGAGISSSLGMIPFFSFMALISVNLGVMNLLPLPMLDGGQLMFLAIEKLKGRALSDNLKEKYTQVGLFFLLGLTIFAVFNDIMRLI